MRPIRAEAAIAASPERIYALLADLGNHWRLTGAGVTLDALDGNDGGTVRLHGPLGISRRAQTRVRNARPPELIEGEARLGSATVARVSWRIDQGSTVTLEAAVERAGWVDRLVLLLGGRVWLRRLLRSTLTRLQAACEDAV